MPVPLFEFSVRLRWHYSVQVRVYETWREMTDAAGEGRKRSRRCAWFFPRKQRGGVLGDVYYCRAHIDDGTILHELKHAVRCLESRTFKRFRRDVSRDEAMAQAIERAFIATRSHIREEMRLL
jgi:hypothetical protein